MGGKFSVRLGYDKIAIKYGVWDGPKADLKRLRWCGPCKQLRKIRTVPIAKNTLDMSPPPSGLVTTASCLPTLLVLD